MSACKFKVAFIGAGSIAYTGKVLYDILSVPEFREIDITFQDLDAVRVERSREICQKLIDGNGLKIKIKATTNRIEAVQDAKYVINSIKVGGNRAWELDMAIPGSYGIDQCVGDTLGTAGIMYGARMVPVIIEMCGDIKKYARPDCLLINVSNPMTVVCWAATKYGKVNTAGLCHGVWLGHNQFAGVLGMPIEDIHITCLGVNHMGFYVEVKTLDGKDLMPLLPEAYAGHPRYSKMEPVRRNMMELFGMYCTESNGHTTDMVPWYRNKNEKIMDWVSWNNCFCGETNGYLNWNRLQQIEVEKNPLKMLELPSEKFDPKLRSVEHASYIMEGMELNKIYRGHLNVPNNGSLTFLEDDVVVEVPCYVDVHGIKIPRYGRMDPAQEEVISRIAHVNNLVLEASVQKDLRKFYQAMMLDPLTGAKLGTREIVQMTDELIIAEEAWLPQFKEFIPAAKARIEAAKKNGTYIPTNPDFKGVALRDQVNNPFVKPEW
ncbi:alpha-glucosidase/alpha-galactosidase [Spirochaetia bacterium]|nr:alpha-glucosidase/alpha-galactosidase [Spirochaetia bacterium]